MFSRLAHSNRLRTRMFHDVALPLANRHRVSSNDPSSADRLTGGALPIPVTVTPQARVGPAFFTLPQAIVADVVLAHGAFVPHHFIVAYAATHERPDREWYKGDVPCRGTLAGRSVNSGATRTIRARHCRASFSTCRACQIICARFRSACP